MQIKRLVIILSSNPCLKITSYKFSGMNQNSEIPG